MKTPEPILVAELFPSLLDGLICLLESLSEDEWDYPTACTPWSVKDVCVHLLGGDLNNLSWKRDGFSVFPPIESWDHLVRLLNEKNQLWVRATWHFSPRLIIDLLRFSGDKVTTYFQSLDPFEMGVPVAWVSSEPAPVWLDLAREYTERWHHQQHIRDAVNKPGFKESKYLSPILDAFILALPRTFEVIPAKPGTSLQIQITGNVDRNWILLKESRQWMLYEGSEGEHEASIILEDDLVWRIFTKGILKDQARKHVVIKGNPELGERILETVSIIA
jgi:hypothetical protein